MTYDAEFPDYANGFEARVRLAAHCLRSGQGVGSRAYDNCFEMYDGAAVVATLDRLARADPALREGIEREHSNAEAQRQWRATADSLAHVPDIDLSRCAARIRRTERGHLAGQMKLL